MLYNHQLKRSTSSRGFTLVELLVTTAIITLGAAASIPNFLRNARQAEVDRYTQTVETGLFSLRAKLGTTKSSCQLSFAEPGEFLKPWQVLEFKQPSGAVADLDRIECCNSKDGCINGPSYRMVQREGTKETEAVEVAVNQSDFMMTPPGTSAQVDDLTILIRSKSWADSGLQDNQGGSRLHTRCLSMSGSGSISRGTWSDELQACST